MDEKCHGDNSCEKTELKKYLESAISAEILTSSNPALSNEYVYCDTLCQIMVADTLDLKITGLTIATMPAEAAGVYVTARTFGSIAVKEGILSATGTAIRGLWDDVAGLFGKNVVKIDDLAKAGSINPNEIRFSQDSISFKFRDGSGSVDDLAKGLQNGNINPNDIPPIRIFEKDGQIFTLDNRRLQAFKQAGVDIPYVKATPEEILREVTNGSKFSTINNGTSIDIRGK